MTIRCECCGRPRRQESSFAVARKKAGYATQVAGAAALGIDQPTLSKIERGDRFPGSKMLLKMADVYKTSLDELVGRSQRSA